MKKRILHVLCVLLVSSAAFGQHFGVVDYDLNATSAPFVTIDGVASTNTITYDGSGITITDDGNALALNQATSGSAISQNGGHGAILKNGHTITMKVANKANITFTLCKYSTTGSTFSFTDEGANDLGSVRGESKSTNIDGELITFPFTGTGQTLTITVNSTGTVYLHAIQIENIESLPSLEGKTQVWDFGAEQLAGAEFTNMLDVATINGWYDAAIVEGSTGNNLPDFTVDVLSWVGKPTSDRLRTTNTALTRFDSKDKPGYTGYIYANGTVTVTNDLPGNRYFRVELEQDDEVSVVDMGNNGTAQVTFVYEDDVAVQNDMAEAAQGTPTEVNFIAKQAGNYLIFDAKDKGSFFRITRKNADFVTISGAVDETLAASIPDGYGIVFTNTVTKKSWTSVVSTQSYTVDLPAGHTYDVSLSDANGYIISSANTIDVTEIATFDITVEQIALFTVSGAISGLGSDIAGLNLIYTPDPLENKTYVPEVTIDAGAGAYSVVLESNCEYTITAEGVNDYNMASGTITITGDLTNKDIVFTAKPTYAINIVASDLSVEQLAALSLTFTHLDEEGYSYTFTDLSAILLRDGVYAITYDGLDAYPIEMGLTSNLVVNGATASKALVFTGVTNWSFDDKAFSSTHYRGLVFSPAVSNEVAKGHVGANDGTTITVPVTNGQKVIITYYHSAGFTVDGGTTVYTTVNSTGSTSKTDVVEYIYNGTGTSIDIVVSGTTTYFTNIEVLDVVEYAAVITVGVDKDYQTINKALDAIALMNRTSEQRVTVEIDPGNYEEMLVIDQPNISFTNASTTPSIALKDAGVNIDDNAVRITSYYGHGYDYYSMGNNQKWNADVLRVNTENGDISYENQGGTTNGSFWNATVVVYADAFEAENIIFENSFNQYISQKESEDIVVEKAVGGKGTRPTDAGNTSVQQKSFIERAAALAINGGDKMILNNCRLVGRQDVFYGGIGSRVAVYKGNMMGGTDYIFGGMTAVFYQSDIAMNTSEDSNDVSYITAGQQGVDNRGYLMYECTITSAIPGVDNAATYRSKPGSFGRCWSGPTCEVVFYNTTIETSNNPSFDGESLIVPEGWTNGLGGPSLRVGEFGTTELSGVDNSANRFSGAEVSGDWGITVLTSAVTRGDAVALTPLNFTKGSDGWDPISVLVANDPSTAIAPVIKESSMLVYATKGEIVLSNVQNATMVKVYNTQGGVVKTFKTNEDIRFSMTKGCWIVNVTDKSGSKSVKVVTL